MLDTLRRPPNRLNPAGKRLKEPSREQCSTFSGASKLVIHLVAEMSVPDILQFLGIQLGGIVALEQLVGPGAAPLRSELPVPI
ncbi:hypothetical protein [Dyadobacter sp. MSC1_007]|uniref:hypothetical protein n=1 Tax=Dyadobacter sp. MSC1_007 TaxID=2909264 RepID=UPI00202DC796|nr:hypothetical protein [Dyadobacter sp. MSC1_007]